MAHYTIRRTTDRGDEIIEVREEMSGVRVDEFEDSEDGWKAAQEAVKCLLAND